MDTKQVITDGEMLSHQLKGGWYDYTIDEGRLSLLELISKAGAGYYNSHTEEIFLRSFGLLRKDRMPNKKGMRFIMSMVYASSNKKPFCYEIIKEYRT